MINLSKRIYEQGFADGIAEWKSEVAFRLRSMGFDDSKIAHALNVDVEIVKGWFEREENESV